MSSVESTFSICRSEKPRISMAARSQSFSSHSMGNLPP